jgi:LacI family transcriptional regulator
MPTGDLAQGRQPRMKLKDFAQHIGLSPTTVSRALSGYPEVSEATRTRVAEEAARH